MAGHCKPGVLQPGEVISYPARGLPRREKTAAHNDISDFEKAVRPNVRLLDKLILCDNIKNVKTRNLSRVAHNEPLFLAYAISKR
jgi:hypothetical protein